MVIHFFNRDVRLLKEYYQQFQNPKYQGYLDRHVDRYVSSRDGIFIGIDYDDEI